MMKWLLLIWNGVLLLTWSHCCQVKPCPCSDSLTKSVVAYPDSLTYQDSACGFRFALPPMDGWMSGKPAEGVSKTVVFAGVHLGQLVNVVLSKESLNGEVADYLYLIKKANRFETRRGFQDLGLDTFELNGTSALRFVYKAEVVQEALPMDSMMDSASDTTAEGVVAEEVTPYVYTNVLVRFGSCNVWLEVSTPEEAYSRKEALIQDVVAGLKR